MAESLRFERPHPGLQDSYRELVREFLEAGEALIPFPLSFPHDDFDAFVARLTGGLRVEGGNIGYGVRPAERRQGNATAILTHTLQAAREVGLTEALLTCSRTNAGSVRTIERCGGELRSEAYLPERGETIRRYVIPLPGDR